MEREFEIALRQVNAIAQDIDWVVSSASDEESIEEPEAISKLQLLHDKLAKVIADFN